MKSVLGSPCGTTGALGRTRCSRLSKCSRKRVRISFPVIRGYTTLRGEALEPPTTFPPAHVPKAVVQTIGAVLPELDPVGSQRKAAPVRWQGHRFGITLMQLGHRPLQHGARADDATLA